MDFVSIEFVRSQGLKPCSRKNHSHKIPSIEAAGCLAIKTYGVYHLHCTITDRWGRPFSFARPFVAMDRDPEDTPILLGRPALQEFRIVLINSTMDWEFERKKKVTEYSTKRFKQMLRKPVQLWDSCVPGSTRLTIRVTTAEYMEAMLGTDTAIEKNSEPLPTFWTYNQQFRRRRRRYLPSW